MKHGCSGALCEHLLSPWIKNYSVNMMILGFLITPIWSEMPEPINVDHSVLKGLPLQFLSIVTKLLKLILILCPLMERLLHCLSARRLWVWIQASPHSPKTCQSAQVVILILQKISNLSRCVPPIAQGHLYLSLKCASELHKQRRMDG